MRLALGDVRVIEYGDLISAPYCSKLLADMGAEVIKVEKPSQGDTARKRGPFLKDIPGNERSGLFLHLNTNKRGITLDIEQATGREIFRKLIKEADILIEDTKPGKLAALGLGYKHLKAINPSIIMASITPFGQTGPYKKYKGTDLIAWHMGGAGYVTPRWSGDATEKPLRALQTGSFITGATAAVATMCALHVQRHTGFGQQVDVSQLESMVLSIADTISYWPYENRSATRTSKSWAGPRFFCQAKDGWIFIMADEPHHWQRFVEVMGNPDWADSELFKDKQCRGQNWENLEALISDWAKGHTREAIFAAAKAKGIPIAPVHYIDEVVHGQQLQECQGVSIQHR